MKSSTLYKPESEFSLLLQGPPKTGKTCLAMAFPDPWFLQADRNLRSAVKAWPGKRFFFDYPDEDDKGEKVEPSKRWTRATELIKEAVRNADCKTIVIDSLTPLGIFLEDHCVAEGSVGRIPSVGGIKVMDQALWRPYRKLLFSLISMLNQTKKPYIVIAHDAAVEDKQTGAIRYRPLVGGSSKDHLASQFTDVWRADAQQVGKETEYFVNTKPIPRCESLACSVDIPAKAVLLKFDAAGHASLTADGQKVIEAVG